MTSAVPEQRMLVAPCSPELGPHTLTSVMLPAGHKGGGGRWSCVVDTTGRIAEVQQFKAMHSAWLLPPHQLLADGSLYLATPVDPLFALLPVLDAARQQGDGDGAGVFCDMEQLLDGALPGVTQAAHSALQCVLAATASALPCICDVRHLDGGTFVRLNEQRALAWLLCKVAQARSALRHQLSGLDTSAQDAYVVAFLSEYLAPHWVAKLSEHLKIQDAGPASPDKAGRPAERHGGQPVEKKLKMDPKEVAREAARKKAEETRAATAARQAAGCKKISSFFAPKPRQS